MGVPVCNEFTPSLVLPRRGEGFRSSAAYEFSYFNLHSPLFSVLAEDLPRSRRQTQLASRMGADRSSRQEGRRAVALSLSRRRRAERDGAAVSEKISRDQRGGDPRAR